MHALTTHPRTSPTAMVLLVAVCAAAASLAVITWGVTAMVLAAAVAPATAAAAGDAGLGRIPDSLVAATAAPAVVVVLVESTHGRIAGAATAVALGVALLAGPLLTVHLVVPMAMGFGDVKLGAALGAVLGLLGPRAPLFALCVASAGTALVGVVRRRGSLPLGPGLVAGTAAAITVTALTDGALWPWR